MLTYMQKINLITQFFLKILPKWYYQLVEDFDVYLHAKNKLHHSLLSWKITFYRILQFDWLTAFWPITREPEFCQIWDWWWNINNNIGFHFKLFPGKTNDNIFQKVQKTYLAAILGPFCPNLDKNELSWKKGSVSYYIFQLYTIVPKIRKNYWAIS